MILLAFCFPLAVYLIVLGAINRRHHPVLVAGTWDGLGLLFAASGFLLFGGPAILSSLSEPGRAFWLFGQPAGADTAWPLWVFLAALYFAVVVAGSAWMLYRQRHLTSIYNVDPSAVEQVLADTCAVLGLEPVRSGNLYLFGLSLRNHPAPRKPVGEGIQAPHRLARASHPNPTESTRGGSTLLPNDLLGQSAILEVDTFRPMRHVTLRWDPADSLLRQEVEAELSRRLAEVTTTRHELGAWLTLTGLALLAFAFLGALTLLVLLVLMR